MEDAHTPDPAELGRRAAALVPGGDAQPDGTPIDEMVTSEPLDLGDGADRVISQEPVGPGNEAGGGEFPDRDTPPSPPAPGAV